MIENKADKAVFLQGGSGLFSRPEICGRDLVFKLNFSEIPFSPENVWCPAPSKDHRRKAYKLPRSVSIGVCSTKEAAAKFSPMPFAVVYSGREKHLLAVVGAEKGWHRWNEVLFSADSEKLRCSLKWEEEKVSKSFKKKVWLLLIMSEPGETRVELLARGMKKNYPEPFSTEKKAVPDWWLKPIYCGWGDQVATSLALEGPGPQGRALAYCTQGLYERWINNLERAKIPVGTVTIDAGWSPGGVWRPDPVRWPDLKKFIRKQHGRGRKVILWIPAWFYERLPLKWCVKSSGKPLTADITNPGYRGFLREQVQILLSGGEDGFDADGFKIDQLSYVPSRVNLRGGEHFGRSHVPDNAGAGVEMRGRTRGCELQYMLQKEIYEAAKEAKEDALITSSTVHPYFYDTFDVVRLHDTGRVNRNMIYGMKARAELSKAALPHHPIDADDWIHHNYMQWLKYTLEAPRIGIPCIFYSEQFVLSMEKFPAVCRIPLDDLRLIGREWKKNFNNPA